MEDITTVGLTPKQKSTPPSIPHAANTTVSTRNKRIEIHISIISERIKTADSVRYTGYGSWNIISLYIRHMYVYDFQKELRTVVLLTPAPGGFIVKHRKKPILRNKLFDRISSSDIFPLRLITRRLAAEKSRFKY